MVARLRWDGTVGYPNRPLIGWEKKKSSLQAPSGSAQPLARLDGRNPFEGKSSLSNALPSDEE